MKPDLTDEEKLRINIESYIEHSDHSKEKQIENLKFAFGDSYNQDIFDELWFKKYPTEDPIQLGTQVPDDPYFLDLPTTERSEKVKEIAGDIEKYKEAIEYDPKDYMHLAVQDLSMNYLYDKAKNKAQKEIEKQEEGLGSRLGDLERKSITEDVFNKMLSGSKIQTEEGVQLYDRLGLDYDEYLGLDKTELASIVIQASGQKPTQSEKWAYALQQANKAVNLLDLREEQSSYPMHQEIEKLAYVLDGEGISGSMDKMFMESPELFKEHMKFDPQTLPPVETQRYNKLLEGFTRYYNKQTELLETEDWDRSKFLENQQILNSLLHNMNARIDAKEQRLSPEVIDFTKGDFLQEGTAGKIEKLETNKTIEELQEEAKDTSKYYEVMQTIEDYGGSPTLKIEPDEPSILSIAEKTLKTVVSEKVSPKEGAIRLTLQTLQSQKEDLEKALRQPQNKDKQESIKQQIDSVNQMIEKAQEESPLSFSPSALPFGTDVVVNLISQYTFGEAMDIIRQINVQEEQDIDEVTQAKIDAMQRLESLMDSTTNPKETSLDGVRTTIGQMDADTFEKQYGNMKFSDLPESLQHTLFQNIRDIKDKDSFTYDDIKDRTISNIFYSTDIKANLTTDDLRSWSEWRQSVLESAPGEFQQYFIDISSKPIFDPKTQTFTKEITEIGYILNYILPLASRPIQEAVLTPFEAYAKGGFSQMPSYGSRVAAKIAIGDPGLMGDLPYIAHLYGADVDTQRQLEYVGLALDFLVPWERMSLNPAMRASSRFKKYRQMPVDTDIHFNTNSDFRHALYDVGQQPLTKTGSFTDYVIPLGVYADTALFGTGFGMIPELAVQGYNKIKKGPEVSDLATVLKNRKLSAEEQDAVKEFYELRQFEGRELTQGEIVQYHEAFAMRKALNEGLDIFNPQLQAEGLFPGNIKKQQEYINNAQSIRKDLERHLAVMGKDLKQEANKVTQNRIQTTTDRVMEAQRIYLENTKIPKKITESESFKNYKSSLEKNENLSDSERKSQIYLSVAIAELTHPSNPSKYFETVFFQEEPQYVKKDAALRGPVVFSQSVDQDARTLIRIMQEEAPSTRGTKNFSSEYEADGIPVLFDDGSSKKDIQPKTVVKHYARSMKRKNVPIRQPFLRSSKFLHDSLERKKSKLLKEQRAFEEMRAVDTSELKEYQKTKRTEEIAKTRQNIENIENSIDILNNLGSERYLVHARNKKKLQRYLKENQAILTEEEIQGIKDTLDITKESPEESFGRIQDKIRELKIAERKSKIAERKNVKLQEKLNRLEVKKENETDPQIVAQLTEEIDDIKTRLSEPFEVATRTDMTTYKLSGEKGEQASVRFTDDGDGRYFVESMRLVHAQQSPLKLNTDLYYRFEISKSIMEEQARLGKDSIIIPLGDDGIFHETMGKRLLNEDYAETYKIQMEYDENAKQIVKIKEDLSKATTDDLKEDLQTELNVLRERKSELSTRLQELNEEQKITPAHSKLAKIEERYVELVQEYIKGIDSEAVVEVNTEGDLVVNITQNYREVLGRSFLEEPKFEFQKVYKKRAPEDLPVYEGTLAPEMRETVQEALRPLEDRKRSLAQHIKSTTRPAKAIQVEFQNIQSHIKKLKDFLKNGILDERDSEIQMFRNSKNDVVITTNNFVITGRPFVQGGKRGFLFESLVDNKTGQQIQKTRNNFMDHVNNYTKFATDTKNFVELVRSFKDYLKFYRSFRKIEDPTTSAASRSAQRITYEEYKGMCDIFKIEPTIEQWDGKKGFVDIIYGQIIPKTKKKDVELPPNRKAFGGQLRNLDTSDKVFSDVFRKNSNDLNSVFEDQKDFIKFDDFLGKGGTPKTMKTIDKLLHNFEKTITERYKATYGEIHPSLLRTEIPISDLAKNLNTRQLLDMSSLDVSTTVDLMSRLLNDDYEIFAFGSSSDHMFGNFSNILDQVGGRSYPDMLDMGNGVYVPALISGITKDTVRSIFDSKVVPEILKLNVDIRTMIDLLGREKRTATEQNQLSVLQKIFDIDPDLDSNTQKSMLKKSNEMYLSTPKLKTGQSFFGMQIRHVDRMVDALDNQIRLTKDKERINALKKMKRELQYQKDLYRSDDIESVSFELFGDNIHSNILEFAPDQTSGGVKLRGMMSLPYQSIEFEYKNMIMDVSKRKKSYVENMVLDAVQNGFDALGFDKKLLGKESVRILEDMAQRFDVELTEQVVIDKSKLLPLDYEFVSFVFPKELKKNVTNTSGHRFVRSIETSTPVLVDGNVILSLLNEERTRLKLFDRPTFLNTPYGELSIKLVKRLKDLDEAFYQEVYDIHTATNRLDLNDFDAEFLPEGDPETKKQYLQSLLAKEIAYAYRDNLKDYITIEVEGLDGIDTIGFERFERATKPNRGTIEISDQEQGLVSGSKEVVVEYRPGQKLSVEELIGLDQGIGLNDTLVYMQEVLQESQKKKLAPSKIHEALGFEPLSEDVDPKYKSEVLKVYEEKILPEGFLDSEFAQHPKAGFSILLPLLYLEHKYRHEFKRVNTYQGRVIKELEREYTPVRPEIEEGDVVSEMKIDGSQLRVKLGPNMSVKDYITTNAHILEMIMPDYAYKNLVKKYDAQKGRLTQHGVSQFANELTNYIKIDEASDLQIRGMFDHVLGVLDRVWDFSHNEEFPTGMKEQWDLIFDPTGKALHQATQLIEGKAKYKKTVLFGTDPLEAMEAKKSVISTSEARKMLRVPSADELLRMLDATPGSRMMKNILPDENGNALIRYGRLTKDSEVDPAWLIANVYGIIQARRLQRGDITAPNIFSKIQRGYSSASRESLEQVTDTYYAPKTIAQKIKDEVSITMKRILGDDYLSRSMRDGLISLTPDQKNRVKNVVNALGGLRITEKSLTSSLKDFATQPNDRMYITIQESNSLSDALKNDKVPMNSSAKKSYIHEHFSPGYKTLKLLKKIGLDGLDVLSSRVKNTFLNFVQTFQAQDVYESLPIHIKDIWVEFEGKLRSVTKISNRKMEEIAKRGEEGKRIIQNLEDVGVSSEEAQRQAAEFLREHNFFKMISNLEQTILTKLDKLQYVDKRKLGVFFRNYDHIINSKITTIHDLFSYDILTQTYNVFTSKVHNITEAENLAIENLQKFYTEMEARDFKYTLDKERSYEISNYMDIIKRGYIRRNDALVSLSDETFKRMTGFSIEDKNIPFVTKLHRKILTLLFDGRFIDHPGIDLPTGFITKEHVFEQLKTGQFVFRESGEIVSRQTANDFLFDNGFGFLQSEKGLIKGLAKDATTDEIMDAVVRHLTNFERQSLQTFFASDPEILNNALGINPEQAGTDLVAILGSLEIMSYDFLARKELSKRLLESSYPDVETLIQQRKQQFGEFQISNIEEFQDQIIKYSNRLLSANLNKIVEGVSTEKTNILIIENGEIPTAGRSRLEDIEAFQIAMDITKMSDLEVTPSNPNKLGKITVGAETYILPKDFIDGFLSMREEIIGKHSIGQADSESIHQNLILFESKRKLKTSLVSDEEVELIFKLKSEGILKGGKSNQNILKDALKKLIPSGIVATGGFVTAYYFSSPVIVLLSGLGLGAHVIKTIPELRRKVKTVLSELGFGVADADFVTLSLIARNARHFDEATKKKLFDAIDKESININKRNFINSDRLFNNSWYDQATISLPLVAYLSGFINLELALSMYFGGRFTKSYQKDRRKFSSSGMKEIRDIAREPIKKFLDRLEDQFSPDDLKKFTEIHKEQLKTIDYVLKEPNRRLPSADTVDRLFEAVLNTLSPKQASASLKMAVTSLSGPMYWSTSYFGVVNQSHLDNGLSARNLAAITGGLATYGLTGSVPLSFIGSKMSVLFADAMNSRFGGKRNVYGGPTSQNRANQALTMIEDIQETSLALRAGIDVAVYGALGFYELSGGSLFAGVSAGSLFGISTGLVVSKILQREKVSPRKDKFRIFTRDGKIYQYEEVLQFMETHGVLQTYIREEQGSIIASQAKQLYPKGDLLEVVGRSNKTLNRIAIEMAETYDLYFRIQDYINALEEGLSPAEAGKRVTGTYFNYADLSEFEKKVLREVFLFYSFTRKNMAFMFRKILEHPERLGAWLRLSRDSQKMATREDQPERLLGDFWEGRLVIPPVSGLLSDYLPVAMPTGKYKSVQIAPMTNVYDLMHFYKAVIGAPYFSDDGDTADADRDAFAKYLLTSASPLAQIFVVPLTKKQPFSGRPLTQLPITSRQIMSMKSLGTNFFGPIGSDAFIKYKRIDISQQLQKSMPATIERREMKPPGHPLDDYAKYLPATESDAMKLYFINSLIVPASTTTAIGKMAFPFVGQGRALRGLEALDRLDVLSQDDLVGASLIDLAVASGVYTTPEELYAQAQQDHINRGGTKDDHEEIAKRAKQIFKTKFKNYAQTKGLSGADIDQLEFFIEEYVKTDAISISSILGHTYGLPYAPIGSIDYIIQQEYKNLEYKIK